MLNISKKGKVNLLATTLVEGQKYKTVADLEVKLQISRRSVFYWLKQLNATLQQMNLDDVQRLPQGGYFLTQETLDELNKHVVEHSQPELNADNRQKLLIWLLIQQKSHLSLVNLSERFGVSKNTIIKDFKQLAGQLPPDTKVVNTNQGKILTGSEAAQRNWVYNQLEERNQILVDAVKQLPDLTYATEGLTVLQRKIGNYYSGDAIKTLILYTTWVLDRLNGQHKVIHDDATFPMDEMAKWVQKFLSQRGPVPAAEVGSLRRFLLAGQLQHVNQDNDLAKQLFAITAKVARRFSSVSGIDLTSENFLKDLTTHLYSTYFHIGFNIQYHNANLSNVKVEYSYLMNLTKYALKPFEKFLGSPVSSDELALIAIYFGGEVKRLSPGWLGVEKEPDVMLVCTSGIGTSLLLYQQLTAHYPSIRFSQPISLDEFKQYDLEQHQPKLILTTAKIKSHSDTPMLAVHAIPDEANFQQLDRVFRQLNLLDKSKETKTVHAILDIITDYARVDDFSGLTASLEDYFEDKPQTVESVKPSLLELLPLKHIQVTDKITDWQDAVQRSFAPLRREESVQHRYVDQIISITQSKGPYMMLKDGVMLAHATPQSGVNALSMSLLILKHPTHLRAKGEDRPLRVVFGLAPVDRDSHVHALSQLLALLQDQASYARLLKVKDANEAYALLETVAEQPTNV